MKHLKFFEKFKNISENNSSERYEVLGSFENSEQDEFNEITTEWFGRKGKRCRWDICYGRRYWDLYVKPTYRIFLIEGNGDLFCAIVDSNGKIWHCCDSKDDVVVHWNMPINDSNRDIASKLQSVIDEELDHR